MNYKIQLDVRDLHLRVWELNEELLEKVNEYDSLEELDYELIGEGEEPLYETSFITRDCDRLSFVVEDEEGEVVCEIDDLDEYLDKDKTFNEEGEYVEGFEFEGLGNKNCDCLVSITTEKGAGGEAELELEEPFEPNKLYLIRSTKIDDELVGEDVYPIFSVYYQRGEGYDLKRDVINFDPENGLFEEQYQNYIGVMRLEEGRYWDEKEDE